MKRLLTKRSVLLFFTVLFYLVAWNRGTAMLYAMFSLLAATLLIAHLMPRFSVSKVSASRDAPDTAFEGEDLGMRLVLGNRGRTARFLLEVLDSVPAAAPGQGSPMTFVARIRPGESRAYGYGIKCDLRGLHEVGPLRIRSSYPLGICSASKEVPDSIRSVLVYPSVFEISHLPIHSGSRVSVGIADTISKSGGAEEFLGIKEYRQGDSLRHIHWPLSVRNRRLVVKDFEIRGTADVTVLMDLNQKSQFGRGKHSTLEYSVKIAASVSKYALQRGYSLQLLGFGKDPTVLKSSRGIAHLAAVLEALALIRADGSVTYAGAIERTAAMIRSGDTLLLMFSRCDGDIEPYLRGLGMLKSKRIRPIAVFFDHRSFMDGKKTGAAEGSPMAETLIAEGISTYFISRGEDLQEVFRR